MRRTILIGVALLACGCHPGMRRANKLLERGAVPEAEQVAAKEVETRPDDVDARLLLARIYMREMRVEKTEETLRPVTAEPRNALRVAQVYWDEATYPAKAAGSAGYWSPKQTPDRMAIAQFMAAAARYDPSRRTEACKEILTAADPNSTDWSPMITLAAKIDPSCKREALHQLRSWIDNAKPQMSDVWWILGYGAAAKEIDPSTAPEYARAIRDLAARLSDDRPLALNILAKAYTLDSEIINEPDTLALRERLNAAPEVKSSPLLQFAEPPGDSTKKTMRDIGRILEMFRSDHAGRYPAAANFAELQAALKDYLRNPLPEEDGWHAPYEYIQSRDGKSARLISGGPDRRIEAASRDFSVPVGNNTEYGADLIWQNGALFEPRPQ